MLWKHDVVRRTNLIRSTWRTRESGISRIVQRLNCHCQATNRAHCMHVCVSQMFLTEHAPINEFKNKLIRHPTVMEHLSVDDMSKQKANGLDGPTAVTANYARAAKCGPCGPSYLHTMIGPPIQRNQHKACHVAVRRGCLSPYLCLILPLTIARSPKSIYNYYPLYHLLIALVCFCLRRHCTSILPYVLHL